MPPTDFIPTTFSQWGIVGVLLGVVIWVIYAVMRGLIVPRRTVDDIRKDRDERLAQAQEMIQFWKDASDTRQRVIEEMVPMQRDQLEVSKTILAAFTAKKDLEAGKHGN